MSQVETVVSDGYELSCHHCGWTYRVINDDPLRSAQSHLQTSGTYNHIVSIVVATFVTGKLSDGGEKK